MDCYGRIAPISAAARPVLICDALASHFAGLLATSAPFACDTADRVLCQVCARDMIRQSPPQLRAAVLRLLMKK